MASPVEVQLEGDASISIRADDDDDDNRSDESCIYTAATKMEIHEISSVHSRNSSYSRSSPTKRETNATSCSPTSRVVNLAPRLSGVMSDNNPTRSCCLENSRISVNTHDSILDITLDEEEDIRSVLFEDLDLDQQSIDQQQPFFDDVSTSTSTRRSRHNLHHHNDNQSHHLPPPPPLPATPPMRKLKCCHSSDAMSIATTTPTKAVTLFDLTEHFVGLCFGNTTTTTTTNGGCGSSTSCHFDETSCSNNGNNNRHSSSSLVDAYRHMQDDIFELLGCSNSPDADEMEQLWLEKAFCVKQSSCAPTSIARTSSSTMDLRQAKKRISFQERALRVRRLRAERVLPQKRTGLSPTTVVIPCYRSRSFDPRTLYNSSHPSSSKDYFKKMKKSYWGRSSSSLPRNEDEEEGYDSDPGHVGIDYKPPPILPLTTPLILDDDLYYAETDLVLQESFNLLWTLTWHLPQRSVCVHVWLERGTMVHGNTTMLEPNLMWAEAFQPNLHARKLNVTSQSPFSLRLLNLCRILDDYDTTVKYPVARPSCSFLIRTTDAGDFLFEAATPRDKAEIVRRWKLVVARFFTLAILEQFDVMADEFFVPRTPMSGMLVPEYRV